MKERLHTQIIGSAGEYRVMSELLLRGHNPAIRVVDDGVDIVLDNKKTIQVKTISRPDNNRKFYTVSLCSSKWKKGKQIKVKSSLKADFLVVWIIDVNKFFIVPSNLIGYSMSVHPLTGKWKKYLDKWDLLNLEER